MPKGFLQGLRQRAWSAGRTADAAYQPYAQFGSQGLAALSGGPNPFMNPYQNTMAPYFAQQRALAVQGANDQATQAGAFGGSRSAIGAATAGNLADQTAAQFQYQGFNDAQQRALAAANMGFGAIGARAGLPQLLSQSLGPYGMNAVTTQTQDPTQQLLGLLVTLAGTAAQAGAA